MADKYTFDDADIPRGYRQPTPGRGEQRRHGRPVVRDSKWSRIKANWPLFGLLFLVLVFLLFGANRLADGLDNQGQVAALTEPARPTLVRGIFLDVDGDGDLDYIQSALVIYNGEEVEPLGFDALPTPPTAPAVDPQ